MTGNSEATSKDPFYPNPSGSPTKIQSLDWCLGDVNSINQYYHYYSFSPCMTNITMQTSSQAQTCRNYKNCASNTKNYMSTYTPQALT